MLWMHVILSGHGGELLDKITNIFHEYDEWIKNPSQGSLFDITRLVE